MFVIFLKIDLCSISLVCRFGYLVVKGLKRPLTNSYIENITRWREYMNFMFERQEQYLTSDIVHVRTRT